MFWELGNYGFFNNDYISEESLCINDLGVELRKDRSYYHNNMTRDYHGYLFQYTLDGCGIYKKGDVEHRLTKGKAFFISFPEDSQYYLADSEESEGDANNRWKLFYIHFSGPAVKPFFNRIHDINGSVMDLEMDSSPVSLFYNLYSSLQNKKELGRYKGSEWLYRFLIALLENLEFSSKKASPHVALAIDWMRKNYTKQVNLNDMCNEIEISYPHLSRLFLKEQGLTPIEFITQLRIEHGIHLLLNTDLTIKEIAKRCGYSSANYFTKVYKKAMNVTPSQYRIGIGGRGTGPLSS